MPTLFNKYKALTCQDYKYYGLISVILKIVEKGADE